MEYIEKKILTKYEDENMSIVRKYKTPTTSFEILNKIYKRIRSKIENGYGSNDKKKILIEHGYYFPIKTKKNLTCAGKCGITFYHKEIDFSKIVYDHITPLIDLFFYYLFFEHKLLYMFKKLYHSKDKKYIKNDINEQLIILYENYPIENNFWIFHDKKKRFQLMCSSCNNAKNDKTEYCYNKNYKHDLLATKYIQLQNIIKHSVYSRTAGQGYHHHHIDKLINDMWHDVKYIQYISDNVIYNLDELYSKLNDYNIQF